MYDSDKPKRRPSRRLSVSIIEVLLVIVALVITFRYVASLERSSDVAPTPAVTATPATDTYKTLGKTAAIDGDHPAAIEHYSRALEIDSEDAEAYYRRGLSYYAQETYESAIADFDKAIQYQYTPLSYVYYDRGRAHYQLLDYQSAVEDFTSSIQ